MTQPGHLERLSAEGVGVFFRWVHGWGVNLKFRIIQIGAKEPPPRFPSADVRWTPQIREVTAYSPGADMDLADPTFSPQTSYAAAGLMRLQQSWCLRIRR